MTELIIFFLSTFIPKYLFWASLFFNAHIFYVFLKCIRKQEKLSENLSKKDNFHFFLSITYIFTYIFI